MVILGVGVDKAQLLEIASKADIKSEDTPASNVIRVSSPGAPMRLLKTAAEMGCIVEWGQHGQLLVKRRK